MENSFKEKFNKRLVNFSLTVIKLCVEVRKDRNLWPIADQIIRSATSIGANITEARACGSKKDYINFFQIALKSANETIYWLTLLKESGIKTEEILQENEEIARIIGAGVITMKNKNKI